MKFCYNYDFVKETIENNNEYKLLSKEYKNSKTKLKIKHLLCNNNFEMDFEHFYKRKQRCPLCSKTKPLNTETFKKRVKEKYGNEYIVLGEYKNNRTPIKIKHCKCNYEYTTRPDNLLQGYGCPNCSPSKPLNTETFKKRVKEKYGNEYIVLGEYKNSNTELLIKHNSEKCNFNEYFVRPNNFLSNETICPICAKSSKSKGERKIRKWLTEHNISFKQDYTFSDCKNINLLRFDFAININNELILLEYDGRQHFLSIENKINELKLIQKRDNIKNKYCKDKNLKLIRIKYTDYKNIDKILNETFNDYPLNGGENPQ